MSNRGKPLLSNSDADRCEALTVMTKWKIANKRQERCPFMARYSVQGRQFCSHHARMEAVAICVEAGQMKRLALPVQRMGDRVRVSKKSWPAPPSSTTIEQRQMPLGG